MIDATRLRTLEAMGIDVYALRVGKITRPDVVLVEATQNRAAEARAVRRLIVVCAQGVRSDVRLARWFKYLPQTFGIGAGAIEWLEADASGALASAEEAPAYLVLGAAMARALGVQLSTMQQSTATIAVSADPARLPGGAADKRALWQALKPIARRLCGAVG
jgi:hypothetical protein